MAALDAIHERAKFSERLQSSLNRAGLVPDSPTALARFFNSRYEGQPITVHAARKWLVGEAIPTQEKLRVLAHWLDVPVEWLRFGGQSAENSSIQVPASRLNMMDQAILDNIRKLSGAHQEIVLTLIQSLLRAGDDRPSVQGM